METAKRTLKITFVHTGSRSWVVTLFSRPTQFSLWTFLASSEIILQLGSVCIWLSSSRPWWALSSSPELVFYFIIRCTVMMRIVFTFRCSATGMDIVSKCVLCFVSPVYVVSAHSGVKSSSPGNREHPLVSSAPELCTSVRAGESINSEATSKLSTTELPLLTDALVCLSRP